MITKIYRVKGTFVMGDENHEFTKEYKATCEADVEQKIYQRFGSKHGINRNQISIKEIKNSKHKPIPLILLVLSIVLLSLIIFRKFLFGGYSFLTKGILSELLRANLPTYYGLYDAFKSGGIWSWSMGIGDTIFTHADVLGDPFTYIIFLGGRAHIPDMFIWHFLIKLVFEGITCYFYLFHFNFKYTM